MYYAYIIDSIAQPDQRYVGSTPDLKLRLRQHNAGESFHTAMYRPWKLSFYAAFASKEKARAFERYLKTGSGREFTRRHF